MMKRIVRKEGTEAFRAEICLFKADGADVLSHQAEQVLLIPRSLLHLPFPGIPPP